MRTKLVTRYPMQELQMDTIKLHCRIMDEQDESLLQTYATAAIDLAEKATNRKLTPCIAESYIQQYQEEIRLPFGEVDSVIHVIATAPDGGRASLQNWTFNEITESVKIDREYANYSDFNIQFSCGYKAGTLPGSLLQGLYMAIATFYNTREDISYGVVPMEAPRTSMLLFRNYRIPNGGWS